MSWKKLRCSGLIIWLLMLLFMSSSPTSEDSYHNRLFTPTYITKIDGTYFIVDCWNHRILYNDNLKADISMWNTLDDDIAGPHSIASDGELYLAEDTGRNRLFVYKEDRDGYIRTQIIDGIDGRPHMTIYDGITEKFYVLTSMTQNMYVLSNQTGTLVIDKIINLDFLEGAYTRSFSIIDGMMYFVSGPQKISTVNYTDGSFSLKSQYEVPEEYNAMNGIYKIDDYFYMSIYPENLIRLKDLSNFNEIENIYQDLFFKGTPYYFSSFDGKFFLTEIDSNSGIKSFNIQDGKITNIETIEDSGPPNEAVQKRKDELVT